MHYIDEFSSRSRTITSQLAITALYYILFLGRREMLREHCPPQSPRKSERSGSNPWVVLDSDGEDENNCDVFPLRENDYVGKYVNLL